jgi:hypothetical protein
MALAGTNDANLDQTPASASRKVFPAETGKRRFRSLCRGVDISHLQQQRGDVRAQCRNIGTVFSGFRERARLHIAIESGPVLEHGELGVSHRCEASASHRPVT